METNLDINLDTNCLIDAYKYLCAFEDYFTNNYFISLKEEINIPPFIASRTDTNSFLELINSFPILINSPAIFNACGTICTILYGLDSNTSFDDLRNNNQYNFDVEEFGNMFDEAEENGYVVDSEGNEYYYDWTGKNLQYIEYADDSVLEITKEGYNWICKNKDSEEIALHRYGFDGSLKQIDYYRGIESDSDLYKKGNHLDYGSLESNCQYSHTLVFDKNGVCYEDISQNNLNNPLGLPEYSISYNYSNAVLFPDESTLECHIKDGKYEYKYTRKEYNIDGSYKLFTSLIIYDENGKELESTEVENEYDLNGNLIENTSENTH